MPRCSPSFQPSPSSRAPDHVGADDARDAAATVRSDPSGGASDDLRRHSPRERLGHARARRIRDGRCQRLFHQPVQLFDPADTVAELTFSAILQVIEGHFTQLKALASLMVRRAPIQGTYELVAPFSNRVWMYQPCHPRSWSAIVSADCFRRRKRWKKIESGRLASLTAGCVRAQSGRTGTVIVASGTHARSSVTGSRNWATVSVRMSSHSNDRPWTVTS